MRTVTITEFSNDEGYQIRGEDSDGQYIDVTIQDGVAYCVSELHGDDEPVVSHADCDWPGAMGNVLFYLGLINDRSKEAMETYGF